MEDLGVSDPGLRQSDTAGAGGEEKLVIFHHLQRGCSSLYPLQEEAKPSVFE